MSTLKFKYAITIAGIILVIASCKKSKSGKEEKPVETDKPVITDAVKKLFIPIKLESENLTINLKYSENSALISEINGSDGYSVKINYENQLPFKGLKYKNNLPFKSIYFRKISNTDLKVTLFDVDGKVEIPTGSLILTRNPKDQLTSIQGSGNGPSYPYKESTWSYSPAGNVSDITVKDSHIDTTPIRYTHDEKNGIFKNIQHAQLLFLEIGYSFFCADINNRTSYSNTDKPLENTDFIYQYNADDYPKQLTITQSKQTFKITYLELK
nr:hypothetical protein [Pedobacter panaciterrae]